jgi:hypothetical protein
MSAAATQQKIRRIVLTGAITAITVTGTWYGAGLKMKSEVKQVCSSLCLLPRLEWMLTSLFLDHTKTPRSYTRGEDSTAGGTEGCVDCEEVGAGEEDWGVGDEGQWRDQGREHGWAGEETVILGGEGGLNIHCIYSVWARRGLAVYGIE